MVPTDPSDEPDCERIGVPGNMSATFACRTGSNGRWTTGFVASEELMATLVITRRVRAAPQARRLFGVGGLVERVNSRWRKTLL